MDLKVRFAGSRVKEDQDFFVSRLNGHPRHIFIHFISSIHIVIDNKSYDCVPGTCIIYTPKCHQYYDCASMRVNHDWIEFYCEDDELFNTLLLPINTPFLTSISTEISKQIGSIKTTLDGVDYAKDYELEEKMLTLFLSISKNLHHKYQNLNEINNENTKDIFEDIRLRIYQDPRQLTIKKVAKEAGFSQSYFCVVYKKLFKITPLTDLDQSRIIFVKDALAQGIKTIDIVDQLGFTTQEYFYNWFRKFFKMTVNEYLEKK